MKTSPQNHPLSFISFYKAIITLILCLFTFTGFAQYAVSGKVVDEQKMPVPFASVMLKIQMADSTLKRGALTDLNGVFSISGIKSTKAVISISNVGYQMISQEISFDNDKRKELKLPDFMLKADQKMLAGVTITGSKPLIQQKPDRTVMNVSGSVLASGNNLYGILAMAPSVELLNGKLTMNGKSNVLIVLDGKKLPNTTLETLLASIPGAQIERIEFIHNPSSKYDASASGGVIEIYTKRSAAPGWIANVSGNIAQGYRTGGGVNADFRLSTKKLDWSASGSYNGRGQVQRGYAKRELFQGTENVGNFTQQVDLSDGNAKDKSLNSSLNYQLSKNEVIGADINLLSANLNGIGTINTVINERNQTSISNTFNNAFIEIGFSNYNLFYKKTFDSLGSNLMVTANYALYTSKQQQQFNQNSTDPNGVESNYQFRNNAPATYNIYTGTADYTRNFGKSSKLETGLKYTFTDNESNQSAEVLKDENWTSNGDGLRNLGYKESIYAGYINFNQKVGKLSLQAGLRAEQSAYKVISGIDSSYFNLFPNVRLDYQVNDNYSSSLSYAKNINRPSYESLIPYELFIDNYTSMRGNAFLRPEYAHTFSWNQLYKKYSLNVSYTKTTDAISSVLLYNEQSLKFTETQANFLAQQLFSASLTVPVKIASWWNINNRAAVYKRKIKLPGVFSNSDIEKRSKTNVSLNMLNSFKFGNGYSAEVSAYYSSASIYSIYTMSAFSNVSAGIRKSLFNDKAFIKLDVTDIFYNNYRVSSTTSVPLITEGLTKNDTRRVRLSFSYSFDKNKKSKRETIKSTGNDSELNRLSL